MKLIILVSVTTIFCLTTSAAFAESKFIHPHDFKGTKEEQQAVTSYIKEKVKKDYSAIGMDDPLTLRLMEKQNLDAFKKLVKDAKDKQILDLVIEKYCDSMLDMCNYSTIWLMYNQQNSASKQELEW